MKIGPEHSSDGLSGGIHWHINENVQIEYISSNPELLSKAMKVIGM